MKSHLLLTLSFAILLTGITVGAAFAQDCWVAIAYNRSKSVFAIESGPTLPEAQIAAMKEAGMPGASIWSWRKGGCLSVATDKGGGNSFGMDGGDTPSEANEAAIAFCKKMGGKNCQIKVRDCCQ